MAINLKHTATGLIKESPEGFSWTTFFFGAFVSMFRGMWGAAAICLFTGGLANFYYMFKINKLYAVKLLENGYKPASQLDTDKLKAMGICISSEVDHERINVSEEAVA